MHESLLPFLISPVDGRALRLDIFETGKIGRAGDEQILSGSLTGDQEEYPIIRGIPRLLRGDLLTKTLARYPEFSEKYSGRFSKIPRVDETHLDLKLRTQESFGVQWNLFGTMYDCWKENFRDFLRPHLGLDDFRGQCVLDAGCGFGRHLYYAAESGAAPAIGVDLSYAVDAAAQNVAVFRNAHVIQADIFHLPFSSLFDIIYCLGVLQHLPEPLLAFRTLSGHLMPGGRIHAWIYGKRPASYHLAVDPLRKLTARLHPRSLILFTWVLAALSFTGLALPRRLLARLGRDDIGEKIPFSRYAQFPFKVSHADWYDRLAAPKTEYFEADFPHRMLESADLTETQVTFREGGSWRLFGVKKA